MTKNFKSRYFEDYNLDETINHSVPRTITSGDVSLYLATTGSRFSLNYSKDFALADGLVRTEYDAFMEKLPKTFHSKVMGNRNLLNWSNVFG